MNLTGFPSRRRLIVITALALSCLLCRAEEASGGRTSITIDFPGGPLSTLVARLNENHAKFAIIQPGGLDPVLPAFAVHNEDFQAIINALGRILEEQRYGLFPVSPRLAVLRKFEQHSAPHFASFQIERKMGAQSIDEFLDAIRAAGEFANPDLKSSTLRFKYHPGTKLLFVAGAPLEIEVARQVIQSLPETPPAPRISTPENK